MRNPLLSVIIPTHNPHLPNLSKVLEALDCQTLSFDHWDVLIIDNASSNPVELSIDPASHRFVLRVIRESRLGLTAARWCGVTEAKASLVIFVDDDNCLQDNYLETVLTLFSSHPRLGAAGGRALPEYELPPPPWYSLEMAPLGCRDLGKDVQLLAATTYAEHPCYPPFAPIGAGMALRKAALQSWLASALQSTITDRIGTNLSSAGDCDIVLHVLESGWDVGYFPSLHLTHLITSSRVRETYLEAISRTAFCDFIRVLDHHGIRPWSAIQPWTLPLRILKAWFRYRAWRSPEARLHWQSAIGQFQGRASLTRH